MDGLVHAFLFGIMTWAIIEDKSTIDPNDGCAWIISVMWLSCFVMAFIKAL